MILNEWNIYIWPLANGVTIVYYKPNDHLYVLNAIQYSSSMHFHDLVISILAIQCRNNTDHCN